MTFQVICPAKRGTGTAYVWDRTENGNCMMSVSCAAIEAQPPTLSRDIPRLEKVFGALSADPVERTEMLYGLVAFQALANCIRHGDYFGWESYIDNTVKRRYKDVSFKQTAKGIEKFTATDLQAILERESSHERQFPTAQTLTKMLWDNTAEMGLRFVVWDGPAGTKPALYAPNLRLAIMGLLLANIESPSEAWALCPVCNKEFERKRKNEIYCSNKCYNVGIQRKFRERQRVGAKRKGRV